MREGRTKIVILGSTGFVGKALMEGFQKIDGCHVTGYSSSRPDLTSPSLWDQLCRVLEDDVTLIVAARSRARDPWENFSDNVTIGKNVARLISKRPPKKCVFFSSLVVYGDMETNLGITEETPCVPLTLYGIGKYTSEWVIRSVAFEATVPLLILRPCKVYGPGDRSHAYGPTGFIEALLKGGEVRIYGDGNELRDHLFIDDLVEITIRMALGRQDGIYNLGSGESRSYRDILKMLETISGRKIPVVSMKRTRPEIDQRMDIRRLLQAIGGFRWTPLKEGLRKTYAWYGKEMDEG